MTQEIAEAVDEYLDLSQPELVETEPIDVDEIEAQRGKNDYFTYIAKALVDDPEVTVDIPYANHVWHESGENIIPPAFDEFYHYARLAINDIQPYQIRFYFGIDDYPSPIVGTADSGRTSFSETLPGPVIDISIIKFCVKHFLQVKAKMPALAERLGIDRR